MDAQKVGYESDHQVLPDYLERTLVPDYSGDYAQNIQLEPGLQPSYTSLNPAPGSVDIIAPRSAGGYPGTARASMADGPNKGQAAQFSGVRDLIPAINSNAQGPNKGGSDQNTQRMMAYETSLIQQLTEQSSASAVAQGY